MYARRPTRPKPRTSQSKKWTAPVAGWVANRALADPNALQEGPGAAILDNFFPRSTSVVLRRGKQRFATLENLSLPVTALFAYRNGQNERLFAANASTIYDVTEVIFPTDAIIVDEDAIELGTEDGDVFGWSSTLGYSVAGGFTGGDWIVAQFATTGGVYLVGVNGADDGFLYDGETFYPWVAGGVTRLNYDGETEPLTEGDTLTGGTSGATATIWRVVPNLESPGTGYLLLIDVDGVFDDDETITDEDDGEAVVNGSPIAAAPGIVFGDGALTTADMAYVWVYKNRLFFLQKDSMNAWYMVDVDSIGGDADVYPMAGILSQGGFLMFGSPWSLDSSGDAGLSEQCVMVSNQGEAVVFQGSDPGSADAWAKVGLYRIGKPLGRKAFMRGGGDLAIATTVGLVPLSKAISLDVTALNQASVSYKIADAWGDAVTLRGADRWQCEIWAEGKMAVVAPPDVVGSSDPVMFVSNTETGAWARFTGWEALCMETFRGQLFFGSTAGRLFIANVGGNDDGATYSGAVVPLYEDLGSPSSAKIGKVARARTKSNVRVNGKIDLRSDYDMDLPSSPDATTLSASNTWGSGIWDQSQWGATATSVINQDWRSVGGLGYSLSVCYQVTSGSVAAIDDELIDIEMTFETAEVVS